MRELMICGGCGGSDSGSEVFRVNLNINLALGTLSCQSEPAVGEVRAREIERKKQPEKICAKEKKLVSEDQWLVARCV